MKLEKIQLGDKRVMPFTIPSGIITTQIPCLEKLAREIPELGISTTKSIGPKPRTVPEGAEVNNIDPNKQYGNREPILGQYMPGGFINAVGLTNPGAEQSAKGLSKINFPKDKFLLASIFGRDAEEFVYVAKTLEGQVDGFELNLSCPHAKGYGMQLGQDPEVVRDITRKVVRTTSKPVFAKLTPNAGDIGEIAKSAVDAGATGLVAINTVGPGYHSTDGNAVLTNKVGGLSGIGIMPIGLKCIRDIRQAIGDRIPIIGMGGINDVKDVEAYANVGANIFGIGSSLAGMDDKTLRGYFAALAQDIQSNGWTNNSRAFLQNVDMNYKKVRLEKVLNSDCDFKILETNEAVQADPGQFVFAWIPGVGEKPFSVMNDDPFTLGVLERGKFTKQLNSLKEGNSFYVRGPYGKGLDVPEDSDVVLVGGGCGIAGVYLPAKKLSRTSNITSILAAKDANHLAYLKEFEKYGEVRIATEDGSLGKKGLVTDLMSDMDFKRDTYFVNCGPKAMVDAILPLELKVSTPERVYSSLDYMTRCGVGICGSCSDEKGRRTCIEGPFMKTYI